MPSWKKVVASGSDASFSSLTVDTYVSASSFKGSFTGSLQGTASQAISSSYALTASYALNAGASSGFPFSGSAQITGSLGVTGSFSVNGNTGQTVFASDADTLVISGSLIITGSASITGSLKVSGSITGSLFGTASWAQNVVSASQSVSSSYALTASYALFAANGGGGGVSAIYILDEGVVQGTASYFDFTGAGVTATVNAGTASINIPGGGGGSNTNSQNAILNQSSPAVTWSFTHNLSTLYPVFTIYDNEDNVIIPQKIHAETTSSAFIYFSSARTGTAVASKGGDIVSASFSATASLAYFAISASQAATASSANTFNVRTSLTASGLRYPTADGAYASQVLQTDASGNLSFGDVSTTFDNVYNGEATTIIKGTPVYISGSNGANPKVFRADAADANKMPVTYIVSENISAGNVGRGITLGHIEGINLTGYTPGTSVYVAAGGGWTSTRPTGSNVTVQFLGLVTKEGSGGKGLVLNPGPATLPNIQTGYVWVGDSNSYPSNVSTSSLFVTSASYAATSSYATNFTASNIVVSGTITAQTLVVQTITSSIAYSSGSNIFGNSTANTQTFTGSVNITGSSVNLKDGTFSGSGANLFGIPATGITGLNLSQISSGSVSASISPNRGLLINTSVSASNFTGSFTGSLTGIATSASFASTASYVSNLNQAVSISGSLIVSESITATVVNSPRLQNGSQYIAQDTYTGITAIQNGSQTWGFYPGGQFYPAGTIAGSSYGSNELLLTNTTPAQLKGTIYGVQIVTSDDQTGKYTWDFSSATGNLTAPTSSKLIGTSSWAENSVSSSYASFALTASYSLGGSGFPYSGSAVITGSFTVTQSLVDFSKSAGVTGSFTGSLFGTASYATFALSASFAPGFTTNMSQSVAATTWSFTHNLNTINPIVQVYDLTNSQIIPNQIVGMNNSTTEIRFDYAQAGYAVASNGGGLYVTGSTSTLVQTVGAVTWSFTHNLNNKYNTYEVYDDNDYVLIPSAIKALTNNTAELYFSGPQTGRAVAQFSGLNGAPNATTASYALTATSSSYAATASYLNPITNSYVVLTQVSQSLNFVDDVAAAAGGVPLGGIYRNGNFILIRLS